MPYAAHLVVRERNNEYKAGFASTMPARDGWKTVRSYGHWYGSQMEYKPFQQAKENAEDYAKILTESLQVF